MENGIIFVAGIYGVGKSTLCEKLGHSVGLPYFSAGDLISAINGETYGSNKAVKDKDENQDILILAVNNQLQNNRTFILAGHFCIFDKFFNVEKLPESVFSQMPILKVILLEADVTRVNENLRHRDSCCYPYDALTALKQEEKIQCEKITKQLGIPLYIHQMSFDESDVQQLQKHI